MSGNVSDVDAELLAMAGDSSDDESEMGEVTQTIEDPKSPSQEPKQSVEEPPSIKRGVAQKVRKRGKKRDRKREIEEDLDNLADSPSPDASQASLDRAESGSEADAPASPAPVDDGPLYPLEGKFTDVDDREHVLGLPEIERETILADRAAEVLKREQDLQLKKLREETASKSKRKAAVAGLDDDDTRKSSRAKKSSALDDYKKAREAKGAERTGRNLDAGRGRRRSSRSLSSASDRDADGESEVEWAEPSGSRARTRDEPPADLKDFDRCRLGRSSFAQVLFYPNFEQTINGCFARISVGPHRETGELIYRMTQIKGNSSRRTNFLQSY